MRPVGRIICPDIQDVIPATVRDLAPNRRYGSFAVDFPIPPAVSPAIEKKQPFYVTVLRFIGIGGPIRICGIIGLFDSRFKT
ncbi:MAG: hypothetical protein CMJ74_08045 [Planctomycetaceae bacterium]|nr:hypothetical protein [Planctomycetaceae bacterium]